MCVLQLILCCTWTVGFVAAPPPIKISAVPSSECRSLMDLVLVVDGSDSISAADYDKQRAALANLVKEIDIGQKMARVGIVVYSTGISQVIPISANKNMLMREMYKLSHPRDGTNTALGIETMIELYSKDARVNVPWVCIVITDGLSKHPDQTADQAMRARNMGINMFAVGISHDIQKSELEAIASVPEQVLMLTSFDQLSVSLSSLMKVVCPCPPPVHVDHASVEDGSRTIGSTLLYTCDPGYQQMGNQPIITCRADSTWSRMDFSCLACPKPRHTYANGIVMAGPNLVNTSRQYECKKGFTSPGLVEIICLPGPEGPHWTHPQVTCAACLNPPALPHAMLDASRKGDHLIGTIHPYVCEPGYIPTGPMETTCVDNRGQPAWTPVKNACISCEYPPIIPNADVDIKGNNLVGSLRTYNCLPGFSPTGPLEAVCNGKNGITSWDVTKHRCITCSQPPSLPNAVIDKTGNLLVGANRKYMCEKGFQPDGPIQVLCVSNNGVTFWDGPNHRCIACPVPPMIPHAILKPSGDTLIGSIRGYVCKKGFVPTGPLEIGCVGGRTEPYWTPPEHHCITCDVPPVLPNAVLSLGGDNLVGSKRTYHCVKGFAPSKPGPITLECKGEYIDHQGKAFWDQPSHRCTDCPEPPVLPLARVQPGDTLLGTLRIYECEPGFYATGPIMSKCLDSVQWSIPEHSCSACGPTPLVPHAFVLDGPHVTGTIRSYQCDRGYVPTTLANINCTKKAQWSPVEFECTKCKDPLPVKYAVLEPGDTLVGIMRHYTCLPGYLATGPITSSCAVPADMVMPDWSTPVHYCKDCGEAYPVDFSQPMPGPSTMGAVMHYKCDDGFVPSNQPVSHCMPNGEWSPPNFKCIKSPTMRSFHADTSSHRRKPSPRRNRRRRPAGPRPQLNEISPIRDQVNSNSTGPHMSLHPMVELRKGVDPTHERYNIQKSIDIPTPPQPNQGYDVTDSTFLHPSRHHGYDVPPVYQNYMSIPKQDFGFTGSYYIPHVYSKPLDERFAFQHNSFDIPHSSPPFIPTPRKNIRYVPALYNTRYLKYFPHPPLNLKYVHRLKSKFYMQPASYSKFDLPTIPYARNDGQSMEFRMFNWFNIPTLFPYKDGFGQKYKMHWLGGAYTDNEPVRFLTTKLDYFYFPHNMFSQAFSSMQFPNVSSVSAPYSLTFNYFQNYSPTDNTYFRRNSQKHPKFYFRKHKGYTKY